MRSAIVFDSYDYVRRLREVGVEERQAAIQAEALLDLVEERLVTKKDLAEQDVRLAAIEAGLKRDIKELEVKMDTKAEFIKAELKRDIKELDVKLATVEANLKRDIKELDVRMDTRFKELELRMVIKMGAMILAGIGLLFGLMRAWPLPVQYVPPSPPHAQEMRLPAPTNSLVPVK